MIFVVYTLAILAAAASGEIAWWEGRWIDSGMFCHDETRDRRPISLSWEVLRFGEAECAPMGEEQIGRRLVLNAMCREHGDPNARARKLVLEPSDGGRALVLSDGDAVWHLRKCP